MSLRRHIPLFSLLFFHAMVSAATAQDESPVLFGIAAGYDWGTTSGIFPVSPQLFDCGDLGNGTSAAPWGGIRLLAPSVIARNLGVMVDLAARRTEIHFSSPIDSFWTVSAGEDVAVERQYIMEAGLTSMQLATRFTFTPADRLIVGLGASFGWRFSATFSQSDVIVGETPVRFDNGQRERAISGGERFTATPLNVGASATLGYVRPFGSRLSMLAGAVFSTDLVSAINEGEWKSLRGGLEVAFLFTASGTFPSIPPPPVAALPVDTMPSPREVMAEPALRAGIEFYSLDDAKRRSDTAVAMIHEVEHQREFVISSLLISPGDESMGGMVRLTKEGARRFAIDSLAEAPDDDVRHHLLNVIGQRMAGRQQGRLRLIESPATPEVHALTHEVRSYLREIWGIASQRIVVGQDRKRERHDCDREGLLLTSDDPQLLAPLTLARTERSMQSPTIHIEPTYEAPAGVRRWELALLHGPRQIMRQRSDDEGQSGGMLDWRFLYDQPESDAPDVHAIFRVEDSTGMIDTARVSIPLVVDRLRWRVSDRTGPCTGERRTIYNVPRRVWSSERGMEELGIRIVRDAPDTADVALAGDEAAVRALTRIVRREGRDISIRVIPAAMIRDDAVLPASIVVVFEGE